MTFWGYALAFSRIFWDFCFTLDLSASYDSCQAGRERLPSAEQQHKNQLGLRPVFFQRGVFAELIWTSFLTWIGGWGYHLHPRLLGGPHPRPHLPRHSFKILICFNFTRKIRRHARKLVLISLTSVSANVRLHAHAMFFFSWNRGGTTYTTYYVKWKLVSRNQRL